MFGIMEDNIIKVGLDIGNKNEKVCADKRFPHEFPAAYREVKEFDYINGANRDDMEKVKYNGRWYFVGIQCQNGLPQNKGDKSVREIANMFKLVGLARELRRQGKNKAEFYVVTGTPLNDYDTFKDDYLDLMITKGDDYEIIELNGEEYHIRVKNAYVTKQSACIAPTIPNWKEVDFILFDLGGGTLDIAFFQRGIREKYLTMDFPLNEILEDLGNELNIHKLGISPRPNLLDSGFMRTMEQIILEGRYRDEYTIIVNDREISIKDFCSKWLQRKVDAMIEDVKIKLKLSETDSKSIPVYFVGGGAKLLSNELAENEGFKKKNLIEDPPFINVMAYHTIANKRNWEIL